MICGNRFNGHVEGEALNRVFNVGNKLIAFPHRKLNDVELKNSLTGVRVIRVEVLRG